MDFALGAAKVVFRVESESGGEVISNDWHEVGVRILNRDACELILYRVRRNHGEHEVLLMFEPGSCRLIN